MNRNVKPPFNVSRCSTTSTNGLGGSNSSQSSRMSGFSLLELVVVVGIIAVITSMAVPVGNRWVQSYQLSSATNDLVSALHFARQEALRTGLTTQLCPRVDSELACKPNDGNWSAGWMVVTQENCTVLVCIRKVWPPVADTVQVRFPANSSMSFRVPAGASNRTFTLCNEYSQANSSAKQVKTSSSGQIRVLDHQGEDCV